MSIKLNIIILLRKLNFGLSAGDGGEHHDTARPGGVHRSWDIVKEV